MGPGSANIGPSTQVWLRFPAFLLRSQGGMWPTYLDRVSHLALPFLGSFPLPLLSPPSFLHPKPSVPNHVLLRPPACVWGGGGTGAQEGTCLCTRVGPPSLTSLPHLGVAKATLPSCRGTQGLGLFFRLGQLKPGSLDLGQPFLDLSPVLGDQDHHESSRNRKMECWG